MAQAGWSQTLILPSMAAAAAARYPAATPPKGAWMTVASRLFLMALTLLGSPGLAAGALLAPVEQNRLAAQLEKRPMVFFVAKGPADSCGPGCGEWIAAEGRFERGTAQRFRDFLALLSGRNLPVFFHSAGGNTGDAVQVGMLLRERRMTAGVGRTHVEQCRVFAKQDPCQRLIASGGEIKARLRIAEGQCHSACVLAFAGASNRRVGAGALLGVHSARFDPKLRREAMLRASNPGDLTVAAVHTSLQQYLAMMGIDPRLQLLAARVDPRRMYVLSRDEIARFGVDTAEPFETAWAAFADPSRRPLVLKSMTRAIGADRKEHRTVGVRFWCFRERIWLVYQRELPAADAGAAVLVRVAAGASELTLRRGVKKDESEMWMLPAPAPFLQSVLAAPRLTFTEELSGDLNTPPSEVKLSTAGLSGALDGILKSCAGARVPESVKGPGRL